MTFRVLLDAFLNENQVELENIKLEYCRLVCVLPRRMCL